MLSPMACGLMCLLAIVAASSEELPEEVGTQFIVMKADGSEFRRLGGVHGFSELEKPSYSPAGTHIVVEGYHAETGNWQSRILVLDAAGKNPVDFGSGNTPSWSPDGRKIACSCHDAGTGVNGVGVIDLNTRQFQIIARNGWGIEWAPKGDYVVYRQGGIVVHELATGMEHRPLAGRDVDQLHLNMAISPNGRQLCGKLVLNYAEKRHGVYLMDLFPTGDATQLLAVREVVRDREVWASFAWHPTEPRIVFPMRSDEHRWSFLLYEFDPTKPDPPKLVPGQPLDRWNHGAAWHPDGKTLLILSKKRTH